MCCFVVEASMSGLVCDRRCALGYARVILKFKKKTERHRCRLLLPGSQHGSFGTRRCDSVGGGGGGGGGGGVNSI